jgi:hypothetical protein
MRIEKPTNPNDWRFFITEMRQAKWAGDTEKYNIMFEILKDDILNQLRRSK